MTPIMFVVGMLVAFLAVVALGAIWWLTINWAAEWFEQHVNGWEGHR
jgi:uncharacterized protein involved in outer membrane biogenesis